VGTSGVGKEKRTKRRERERVRESEVKERIESPGRERETDQTSETRVLWVSTVSDRFEKGIKACMVIEKREVTGDEMSRIGSG